MIKFKILLFFIAVLAVHPGEMYSQTQLEMNQQARREYEQADKELNKTYQQILVKYKSDKAFLENLKKAQRLWIQWRDAEIKAKYPDREDGVYGSIHPYCWNTFLLQLTQERTRQLKEWIKGAVEGDGCAGSVKVSESRN